MVNHGMLAEAAIRGHQSRDSLLEPFPPAARPSARLRKFLAVATCRKPRPADVQRGRLGSAVIIVLCERISKRWRYPAHVRLNQLNERVLRPLGLPEDKRSHGEVHNP